MNNADTEKLVSEIKGVPCKIVSIENGFGNRYIEFIATLPDGTERLESLILNDGVTKASDLMFY